MRIGVAVIIIVIAIVGTGGGIYFYDSCTEQKDDIIRKTGTITGSVEGILGLIDNSLMQQIERYNSQCGWLTGNFNIDGEVASEQAALPEVAESEFLENYYSLVDASNGVTENYHREIEKWERDQYDNRDLAEVTDSFLFEYDLLVDKATSLKAPQKYQEALELYIKSLNSERTGHAMFLNFVETGDPRFNETSIDLLSNATKYELESFNLIKSQIN
jgi:hypothetical protein